MTAKTKGKENKTTENGEKPKEIQHTKAQLLSGQRYLHQRDLVATLLEDDKVYTTEQADNMMERFMKRRVK